MVRLNRLICAAEASGPCTLTKRDRDALGRYDAYRSAYLFANTCNCLCHSVEIVMHVLPPSRNRLLPIISTFMIEIMALGKKPEVGNKLFLIHTIRSVLSTER